MLLTSNSSSAPHGEAFSACARAGQPVVAQPVEIDPALEIDRHVAVRGYRPIPAPVRIEMLGADQMRLERVRNIHGG